MEDAEGSTSIAAEIGTSRGSVIGAVALSSYDGFVCSDPLPVFNTGRVNLTMPYTSVTGQWLVRFLGYIPPTGTVNGSSLCRIYDSSFGYADLVYSTGGVLTLYIYDTFGTLISTLGPGGFAVDGKHLQYQIQAKQNGASIDFSLAPPGARHRNVFNVVMREPAAAGTAPGAITSITTRPGNP